MRRQVGPVHGADLGQVQLLGVHLLGARNIAAAHQTAIVHAHLEAGGARRADAGDLQTAGHLIEQNDVDLLVAVKVRTHQALAADLVAVLGKDGVTRGAGLADGHGNRAFLGRNQIAIHIVGQHLAERQAGAIGNAGKLILPTRRRPVRLLAGQSHDGLPAVSACLQVAEKAVHVVADAIPRPAAMHETQLIGIAVTCYDTRDHLVSPLCSILVRRPLPSPGTARARRCCPRSILPPAKPVRGDTPRLPPRIPHRRTWR